MNPTVAKILLLLLASTTLAAASGRGWMTPLDGTLSLSQFSIPGTHDSGARFEPISGTAKCQDLTISEQLNAGVRFLDIRCRHIDNGFTIHHGSVYQNINFNDVLNAVTGFLNANPGETVIMSVKEEHTPSGNTRSFEATFNSYVAQNPSKWLLGSGIPTLGNARGKIVLFRRFGASSTPKGIDASNWPDNTTFSTGGTLRVQDRYQVSDNNSKWAAVESMLNEARYGGHNTLYVNFASGVASGLFGIPNITGVSNNINPRLATFFNANPSGRFGVVLMDFANAARSALIYNTNAPAGRAVHRPAWFMIVNRHSGACMDLNAGSTANGARIHQWAYNYNNPNQRWALAPTEDAAHFRLVSWVSGKTASIDRNLTSPGAILHAWDYNSNPSQQFDLLDAGNGFFRIRNVRSGLVLEVADAAGNNGAGIQQNTDNGGHHQHWRLQPWGDYFIRSTTGKYLSIGNSGGDAIVQSSWENSPWFKWRLESAGDGYLQASSLNSLPRAIGIPGGLATAGAVCHLDHPYSPGGRRLRIIPKTNGLFKFRFVHSNMSWDIPGGQTGDQAPLAQYPDNNNPWQEFQLERLPALSSIQALILPAVAIGEDGGLVTLTWSSQPGYRYLPRWTENFTHWQDLVEEPLSGTGYALSVTEPKASAKRFYQIVITAAP